MVTLIFVRHGFSESNKTNTFTGHLDIPLCDIGYKQAELTSDYILQNFKPTKIYSSPLCRVVDTVKKVADTLSIPLIKQPELIEMYGGDWEGLTATQMKEQYADYLEKWNANKGLVPCPNGESMYQAGVRALKALDKICAENDGETLVIASHGGVIRALQCFFTGLPIENIDQLDWTPNASISIVEYNDGKYTPKRLNIAEHLEGLQTNITNF